MIDWVMNYGQIIAFFAQVLYWLVIAVAAIWAVLLFKRLVDFKTGGGSDSADAGRTDAAAGKSEKVSTDDFVD